MTASQVQLGPIEASIDNPGDWDAITQPLVRGTGLPLTLTPAALVAMIASAVPLVHEAQAAGNAGLLHGTFSDPVVAQCQRNGVELLSGTPIHAVVHLVGGRVVEGRPTLRVHLVIDGRDSAGQATIDRLFWDLELGAQATVGAQTCSNCGAPIAPGELVCGHCRADVRSSIEVPIAVSRLELY